MVDVVSLLAELDQCEGQTAEVEVEVEVKGRARPAQSQPQCSPVMVGGSLSSRGLSSLARPRACDRLLCLTCNIPVIALQDLAWTADTDYIFLR